MKKIDSINLIKMTKNKNKNCKCSKKKEEKKKKKKKNMEGFIYNTYYFIEPYSSWG